MIAKVKDKSVLKLNSESCRRISIGKIVEMIVEKIFLLSSCVSILSVFVITLFIFLKGAPAILKIGLMEFILGMKWQPSADVYGIFPMITGSVYITFGAVLMGLPVGILTAVFLSEIAPKHLASFIRTCVELLAGIPSVVYGFFGLVIIVPLIDETLGGGGNSLLAGMIILAIMILPTIISISENSIRSVPNEYKEGSLALGASKIQTIFKVVLPAAKSGILTSVVLGIGRALGETMAVILVTGNTAMIPNALTDRVRTMTANIAMEMGYAYGLHQEALFATGVVLFIFIIALNLMLLKVTKGSEA